VVLKVAVQVVSLVAIIEDSSGLTFSRDRSDRVGVVQQIGSMVGVGENEVETVE
jgi:hypothetical protein